MNSSHPPTLDSYDVIVVGGGPGGSTTASFLAREGVRVLLVDKAVFPRDKPCGDAISGKSASVLRELGILEKVEAVPHELAEGVLFSGPDGDEVTIRFPRNVDPSGIRNSKRYNYITAGYLCPRKTFDNVLFEHASSHKNVEVLQGFEVRDLLWKDGFVSGVVGVDSSGRERTFCSRIVVGADGALSVVAQKVKAFDRDPDHWIGAFRIYYEGVEGLTRNIEIHFVEDLIPGYFWIFPLGNGAANVGAGMVESDLKGRGGKRKVPLKETTYRLIQEHPKFAPRFRNAREVPGSFAGWLLPLGSKHRPVVGNGWVLVGDAAALIDPFSGEGIGNAMVSGRLASEAIVQALSKGDVSSLGLRSYEENLRRELDRELQMSYKLQKLGRKRWLLNFVLRRAARKERVREIISQMLVDREKKEEFGKASFYLRLLFM